MDRRSVQQSAIRYPPQHRRCSDTSDLNMPSGEGNSSISLGKNPCLTSRTLPTNIDSLLEEILFQILLRLPAESLYDSARLVCRKWKKIIHSKAFINTHIDHHSTYGLLLGPLLNLPHHPVYVTSAQGRIKTYELNLNCGTSTKILASSGNGLTLELFEGKGASKALRVINPATKQPFLLPSVSTQNRGLIIHRVSGIAYSAASKEYKVTLPYIAGGFIFPPSVGLDIVTVGVDESWRKVEVDYLDEDAKISRILFSSPLTTEGFLHWGENGHVLTLDVETEVLSMSEVPIPPQTHHSFCNYLSTGKNLSMLLECGDFWWEVWEMKPENREWRKVLRLKVDLNGAPELIPHKDVNSGIAYRVLSPIGWVKYLEVLAFIYGGEIPIVYNLDTREIETIELPWICRGLAHRNNLVGLS